MTEVRQYQFRAWCIQTRNVLCMLFFQLLKMLKTNIIVEYVKIANVIPIRHCTCIYTIISASNVLVQLPACKSDNHVMLVWHSEVYMIPAATNIFGVHLVQNLLSPHLLSVKIHIKIRCS